MQLIVQMIIMSVDSSKNDIEAQKGQKNEVGGSCFGDIMIIISSIILAGTFFMWLVGTISFANELYKPAVLIYNGQASVCSDSSCISVDVFSYVYDNNNATACESVYNKANINPYYKNQLFAGYVNPDNGDCSGNYKTPIKTTLYLLCFSYVGVLFGSILMSLSCLCNATQKKPDQK